MKLSFLKGRKRSIQLEQTIYGLKQSPREWYRLLDDVLISMGFIRTQADTFYLPQCGTIVVGPCGIMGI